MNLGSFVFHLCVSRRSLQLTLAWFVCVGWVGFLFSVVILAPVFLGALVAVFLVVLVFFRPLSWLQFRAWTRVGFLRGRLVVFFCCCFGWPFRCCLGGCFALCFCVVGCLAPGLDPCMVVLVPVS